MTVFFVQLVGTGQEYCSRIFSQPICIIMALNKGLVASFREILERTMVGMYSQSTRGPELLLQVKFAQFLKVSANLTILQCLRHENKSICQKTANLEQFYLFSNLHIT